MKAINLIKILEKEVEKYGENIEVFVRTYGFNDSADYSLTDNISNGVGVTDVSIYDKNMVTEYWNINGEKLGKGSGFIHGIVLHADDQTYNEDEDYFEDEDEN